MSVFPTIDRIHTQGLAAQARLYELTASSLLNTQWLYELEGLGSTLCMRVWGLEAANSANSAILKGLGKFQNKKSRPLFTIILK